MFFNHPNRCAICLSSKAYLKVVHKYYLHLSLKQKLTYLIPEFFWPCIPYQFVNRVRNVKYTKVFFQKRYWVECLHCGLFKAFPEFSEVELNEFYKKVFWEKTNYNYVNLSDNIVSTRTKSQFAFITKHLKTEPEFFTDFGAGHCNAIRFAIQLNFAKNYQVVDPSTFSALVALNYGVHHVANLAGARKSDFIFSSHSLEHVHSLNETLKHFRRLTRPNALLFIEVPNIDKRKLREGNHVPHTYCFSETSIVSVFKTFGFQLVNPNALEISYTGGLRALFQKIDNDG